MDPTNTSAMRESAVRETRFSQRDSVGCEAKGVPVSGKRSRSSVQMGSCAKCSRRWRLHSLRPFATRVVCAGRAVLTCRASRGSDSTAASARVRPSCSSGSLRKTRPASADKRPPAKSRSTALSPPGASCSGGALSAGIASIPERVYALGLDAFMWVHSEIVMVDHILLHVLL